MKLTEKQEKNRQLVEGWLSSDYSAEYEKKVGKTGKQLANLKYQITKAGIKFGSVRPKFDEIESRNAADVSDRLIEAAKQVKTAKQQLEVAKDNLRRVTEELMAD